MRIEPPECMGNDTRLRFPEVMVITLARELPDEVARIRDLVERMETDRSILRGEQAAALHGLDLRTLQRRSRKFVRVSPKWAARADTVQG
jgi:hypothetical protein